MYIMYNNTCNVLTAFLAEKKKVEEFFPRKDFNFSLRSHVNFLNFDSTIYF